MQASKTWLNFKCKYIPYNLRKELKYEEIH